MDGRMRRQPNEHNGTVAVEKIRIRANLNDGSRTVMTSGLNRIFLAPGASNQNGHP